MGKRTRDFAFVSLCYGRSGEDMCTGYAMAASGRMQYDYKQTNKLVSAHLHSIVGYERTFQDCLVVKALLR